MKEVVLSLLLLYSSSPGVHAYSQGAPRSACESMRPSHGSRTLPQRSRPPFSIEVTGDGTYKAGQKIEVVLKSDSDHKFKGFFIQARNLDGEKNVYGTFTPEHMRTTNQCSRSGLTHRTSSRKTEMSVTWKAPDPPVGDLMFVATFVEDYRHFWLNVTSPVIKDEERLLQENQRKMSKDLGTVVDSTQHLNATEECYESRLVPLPTQRPHVAILCSDRAQCPCTWRCCPQCNGHDLESCQGHAICRQTMNVTESEKDNMN